MEQEFDTEKWNNLWDLYDKACWVEYLQEPMFQSAYNISEFELRNHIYDQILLPAIEEVETNIEKLQSEFKFLYWYKVKESLGLHLKDLF